MKPPDYIKYELKRAKGNTGTKDRHNTELGLHSSDYKNGADYQRARSAKKRFIESQERRELVKAVNGTIFVGGYDEEFVTANEGEIL